MEAPRCQSCTTKRSEIVVLPGDNPEVITEYLCSDCFKQIQAKQYQALPFNYVTVGSSGEMIGMDAEFCLRAGQLIVDIYEYQEQLKEDVKQVSQQYLELFTELQKGLSVLQSSISNYIIDCEARELEYRNGVILSLRSLQDKPSLKPSTAFLASSFNAVEKKKTLSFINVPEELSTIMKFVTNFPRPIIDMTDYSDNDNQDEPDIAKRMIEDNVLIMPMDARNVMISDLVNKSQRMLVCSTEIRYRAHAKWCKVDENTFIYTGGLINGKATPSTDFLELLQSRTKLSTRTGRDMRIPRYGHAIICHETTVFVFGGACANSSLTQGIGIELMQHFGDWERMAWKVVADMPEIFEPTVTVLKSSVYIAGKHKGVFRYDIESHECVQLRFLSRIIDLQVAESGEQITVVAMQEVTTTPLPRQSSNSLIFAWESQVFILQHDLVFAFMPTSGPIEMTKKRIGRPKAWYTASPVVIDGSRGYFTLEPIDFDITQTVDVWSFDFVKKEVGPMHPSVHRPSP